MTTRPTDEEIRSMLHPLRSQACFIGGMANDVADWLEVWLAERQAARDGVTDDAAKRAVKIYEGMIIHSFVPARLVDSMRAALQSISQPITSVSDALNFLEEWALSGNKLHGDDIQQFNATVERIAPIAQSARVPDEKSEVWVVQDETGCPIYCASYAQACHEHINDAINEHGIEEACAWKVIHYENSTSPRPQQAVPDGWMPIETAPKDGTTILLACRDRVTVGDWISMEMLNNWDGNDFEPHWQSWDGGFIAGSEHDATHWIPLPTAPAYNGKKEG